MSDLRELYQEVILAHNKSPRNFRPIPDADRTALGHNPLCGDQLTLFLKLDGDVIEDAAFQGKGCAISKASASLMTDSLKGKSREQALAMFGKFHDLLTGPSDVKVDAKELGKLAVFSGVREFPVRVKCATLAWQTLRTALEQQGAITSTE